MDSSALKVGEVAQRTGISVRALHHYDEIGLLRPSRRSAAGHRLYAPADVTRLLRIVALQQLGLPLAEIARLLDDGRHVCAVLSAHVERLRERMAETQRLCERLESLLERLDGESDASVGVVLEAIEVMTMFEKYYTEEQMRTLQQRRQQVGEDRIREVEAEWPRLIAAVRAEMASGTDPADPKVQELARRWRELLAEFTGGDAGIARAAGQVLANEPSARQHTGLDAEVMAYIGRAMGTR